MTRPGSGTAHALRPGDTTAPASAGPGLQCAAGLRARCASRDTAASGRPSPDRSRDRAVALLHGPGSPEAGSSSWGRARLGGADRAPASGFSLPAPRSGRAPARCTPRSSPMPWTFRTRGGGGPADTGVVPDSGPTVASRTCMVVGGILEAGPPSSSRIGSGARHGGILPPHGPVRGTREYEHPTGSAGTKWPTGRRLQPPTAGAATWPRSSWIATPGRCGPGGSRGGDWARQFIPPGHRPDRGRHRTGSGVRAAGAGDHAGR